MVARSDGSARSTEKHDKYELDENGVTRLVVATPEMRARKHIAKEVCVQNRDVRCSEDPVST